MPDLSVYYQVQAPDEQLDQLAERLREHTLIAPAYAQPPMLTNTLDELSLPSSRRRRSRPILALGKATSIPRRAESTPATPGR